MVNKTGVVAFVLCLAVVLLVCGCMGHFDAEGNWVSGSYDGGSATLSSQKTTITLTDITGGFEESKANSSGTFHFWANQENGGPIEMTGTYAVTGNTIAVTATPAATRGQKGSDSISMSLNITSSTSMAGSMGYNQGGTEFAGDISFKRYADQ